MKKYKKSIAKEKNNSYNNKEKIIFQKLPEVKQKSRKTYLITFILISIFMYSGWLGVLVNKTGIESLSTKVVLAANIIKFLISILILFIILKNTLKRDFIYYMKNWRSYLKYGISTLIVFGIIEMVANGIIANIVGSISENENYVKSLPLTYQLIFGVFLGAIIEEGLFRGLLKKIIKNKYMFLIISSIFFGAMHVIFDISNPMNILYIFTYAISGLALAYNYEKTDNLVSPIVMHMISNLLSVVLGVLL